MIGLLLQHYRKRNSLSLRDLALDLGMHYSMLAKIEAGDRFPRKFIPRIARLLERNPTDLSVLIAREKMNRILAEVPRSAYRRQRGKPISRIAMKPSQENFSSLEASVIGMLRQGMLSFTQILRHAANVDPRALEASIKRLTERGIVKGEGSRYRLNVDSLVALGLPSAILPKPEAVLQTARDLLARFPTEAPTFSQWWFTAEIVQKVFELLVNRHPTARSFCFVGAPSLGATFASLTEARVAIVDIDPTLCKILTGMLPRSNRIEVVNADIAAYHTGVCYDVVYSDPPWDFGSLDKFVVGCPALVAEDGYFYISYPGQNTRPTVVAEKVLFGQTLGATGLACCGYERGFLTYRVPQFELSSYADIIHLPKDFWRQGDLAVYERAASKLVRAIAVTRGPADVNWEEFVIGGRRIFLKREGSTRFVAPTIEPLFRSATKPSTSSRDVSLDKIGLWTSQNEVFATSGNHVLRIILRCFEGGLVDFDKMVAEVADAFQVEGSNLAAPLRTPYSRLHELLDSQLQPSPVEGWGGLPSAQVE